MVHVHDATYLNTNYLICGEDYTKNEKVGMDGVVVESKRQDDLDYL